MFSILFNLIFTKNFSKVYVPKGSREGKRKREKEREREKESLPTTNYHAFSFPKECFADIGTVSLKISDFHYNSWTNLMSVEFRLSRHKVFSNRNKDQHTNGTWLSLFSFLLNISVFFLTPKPAFFCFEWDGAKWVLYFWPFRNQQGNYIKINIFQHFSNNTKTEHFKTKTKRQEKICPCFIDTLVDS